MFHKHEFTLRGNSLWCKCGKVRNLPCCHKWEVHRDQTIEQYIGAGKVPQSAQTLICETCGQIQYLNLTTGERK